MYKYANIKGFYGLPDLELGSEENPLPRLNVVVGTNSTGKTALLKLLYSFRKALEEKQSDSIETTKLFAEYHSQKLFRLFFPKYSNFADLVTHNESNTLVSVGLSGNYQTLELRFEWLLAINGDNRPTFGIEPKRLATPVQSALFIPAKEVLTIVNSIALSREQFQLPEFDDSYYDLVKALRVPPPYQANQKSALKEELDSIFEGNINHDRDGARAKFVYYKDGHEYGMAHTAEGIKKIGMLSLLLANGMIDKHTVLFIDEPETALHPEAQRKLIDFLAKLSNVLGIQIFMATHSYYVVNQLANVALEYNTSVNCVSLEPGTKTGYKVYDLLDGMPHIPIMEEALAMQHQNLKLALAQR